LEETVRPRRTTPNLERCFRFILASSAVVPALARAQSSEAAETRPSAVLRSGTLSFSGHATVGDFVGSTSAVSGEVTGDISTARGWVETAVATLVTHNEHRDRDLRASMEVDRYPTMRFDLTRAAIVSSLPARGDTVAVLLHGTLAIHGVTRPVDVPAILVLRADTIHLTSSFPLNLDDYRIGGLTKMLGLLRMDPRIEVRVDLHFVATSSPNLDASSP
jgi:polyisoprenoid-binding protein YceI